MYRRRSRIDDDRSAVGQLVERDLGDPLLLPREPLLAVSHCALDPETLHGNRPAVNSPQHPQAFKRRQVPADGFGGHVKIVGKPLDLDAAITTGSAQDLLVAFYRIHPGS